MSQAITGEVKGPRFLLSFMSGPRTGEKVTLPLPVIGVFSIIIGRNRDCAVCIESNDVSRRHAEIFMSPEGQIHIHDLGSINGTLVNERPATQVAPIALLPGDHIKVGLSEMIYEGVAGMVTPGGTLRVAPPLPPPPTSLPPKAVYAPAVSTAGNVFVYIFLRNGQRYRFDGDEVTIGRVQVADSDIVINSNSISRQHARLTRTPTGIYVTDLGSTNKTFVNGLPADGPILLHNGDVIRFGDVEADFKVEEQRLSTIFRLEDFTTTDNDNISTNHDIEVGDHTYVGFGEQTSLDMPSTAPDNLRRSIEEGETNLAVSLVVVGRSQRQASAAIPEGTGLLRRNDRTAPPPSRLGPEISRLEGVFYTEGTGRAASMLLKNVSVGLRQGELVALVGPSGSGKTELLQIMGGFLPADRGLVSVLGYVMPTNEAWRGRKRLNLEEEREHVRWRNRSIGYMTSDLNQLNSRMTALELITNAIEQAGVITDPRRRNEIALERLQLVGLTDPEIPRLKPPELNRREKQLVALARALANDPPLLLADEPTGNLTSDSANYVFKLLQQFVSAGKTIFMVTHDDYWARNASRQIEILDGEIVGGLA